MTRNGLQQWRFSGEIDGLAKIVDVDLQAVGVRRGFLILPETGLFCTTRSI